MGVWCFDCFLRYLQMFKTQRSPAPHLFKQTSLYTHLFYQARNLSVSSLCSSATFAPGFLSYTVCVYQKNQESRHPTFKSSLCCGGNKQHQSNFFQKSICSHLTDCCLPMAHLLNQFKLKKDLQ